MPATINIDGTKYSPFYKQTFLYQGINYKNLANALYLNSEELNLAEDSKRKYNDIISATADNINSITLDKEAMNLYYKNLIVETYPAFLISDELSDNFINLLIDIRKENVYTIGD